MCVCVCVLQFFGSSLAKLYSTNSKLKAELDELNDSLETLERNCSFELSPAPKKKKRKASRVSARVRRGRILRAGLREVQRLRHQYKARAADEMEKKLRASQARVRCSRQRPLSPQPLCSCLPACESSRRSDALRPPLSLSLSPLPLSLGAHRTELSLA